MMRNKSFLPTTVEGTPIKQVFATASAFALQILSPQKASSGSTLFAPIIPDNPDSAPLITIYPTLFALQRPVSSET